MGAADRPLHAEGERMTYSLDGAIHGLDSKIAERENVETVLRKNLDDYSTQTDKLREERAELMKERDTARVGSDA